MAKVGLLCGITERGRECHSLLLLVISTQVVTARLCYTDEAGLVPEARQANTEKLPMKSTWRLKGIDS